MDRRSIIKSIGASSVPLGFSHLAGANSGSIGLGSEECEECEKSWEDEKTFNFEGYNQNEFVGSISTAVGYFGSTYIPSREAVYHDFRFTTTVGAECIEDWDPVKEDWFGWQHFEISSQTLEWAETTKDEHFGVYPTGEEDSSTIDLGSPAAQVAALALGAMNPTVGFAAGATTLVGSLMETNASQTEDGLTMWHAPETCNTFGCSGTYVEEAAYHKRVFAVQDYDNCPIWKPCKDSFTIETATQTSAPIDEMKSKEHLDYIIEFNFVVDGHDRDMEPTTSEQTPLEDMSEEELERAGVKRVETGGSVEVNSTSEDLSVSERDMVSRFSDEGETIYLIDFDIKLE